MMDLRGLEIDLPSVAANEGGSLGSLVGAAV